MHPEQKRLLCLGAWLVGLMTLFPPWCIDDVTWFGQHAQPQTRAIGYSFIGNPPTCARVDVARLAFQLVGLTSLIAAHAWAWSRARAREDAPPPPADGIVLARARRS